MTVCLPDDQLERFVAEELPEDEMVRVREHLCACSSCADRCARVRNAAQQLLEDLRELGAAGMADAPVLPERLSLRIDGYEVVRELRRGGQGVVFEARQEHTKRKVAIKVLLEGAYASASARRRFEREIELAAQLKHSHIVTVFHSGLTPDGRQYCVMDYVDGQPLDRHVRTARLTLDDTLELFATVCEAVAFAHQRGIIHRDLKPSNILVDAVGTPRILDFGLAKQLHGASDTYTSQSGQVFGTLPYISPEQTRGRPDEIDTRTDVYSLGVILYQLLTGQFPYPVDDQFVDVIRHITDTPPAPPSRVWTGTTGVTTGHGRRTSLTRCPIDEEVQTIVFKALAKEPERRYQSVRELAGDLRHYLAGEPIAAKRDSRWYVLQKTVRRYKVRFAVAATIILVTLGSTVALSIMYSKQTRLLEDVEKERNRAVDAEDRAERRFDQVRELAGVFIFDFHDEIQHLKGATPARELLVTTALAYLDALAADASDDPGLLHELAVAYMKVGDVQGQPGAPNLGDSAGAITSYEKGLGIFQMLCGLNRDTVEYKRGLADCHNKLGMLKSNFYQTGAARDHYERAFEVYTDLVERDPREVDSRRGFARGHMNLGDVQLATGQATEALVSYECALRIREELAAELPTQAVLQRELALSFGRIGDTLRRLGDHAAALENRRRSLDISEALAQSNPDDAQAQRDLAEDIRAVGDALRGTGEFAEALTHYQRSLGIRADLARADPLNAEAQRDLALGYNRVGGMQRYIGDISAALATYQGGLQIVEAWAAAHPDDVRPRKALRVYHTTIGDCYAAQEHWPEALDQCERALEIATKLAAADPQSVQAQRDLSVCYHRSGDAYAALEQVPEALTSYSRCLEIRERLAEVDPRDVMFQRNLAEVRYSLGKLHAAIGADTARALTERLGHWRQARTWFQLACDTHTAMQNAGTLISFDANMPAEDARRLEECDAAIADLEAPRGEPEVPAAHLR